VTRLDVQRLGIEAGVSRPLGKQKASSLHTQWQYKPLCVGKFTATSPRFQPTFEPSERLQKKEDF
jgi:hypothetical protein